MQQASRPASAAFVILVTLFFVTILMILRISAIPWEFTYLEIGRITGPIPGLVFLALILIVILLVSAKILVSFLNSTTHGTLGEFWTIMKKKKTISKIVLGLALSFLIIFSFSLVFMPQVLQASKKIDMFVAANANQDFQDYINNVSSFSARDLGNF